MAGVGDHGFGQGVCAGDVNQDGLPDLLVANIGDNVAFINQGDGTFRQADLFAVEDPNWTSSLALADLSGDHLPDIFGVNYIDDATAMTKHCESVEACMPQQFNAAIDSVLLGLPSGEFESGQSIATTEQFAEYGFGIVIANFDHQFGNDLFVTNDGDLNHFWSSIKNLETASSPFRLIESAGLRGCSIGRGGNSQACMGVASGDFNRDGHLDLHVTNFLAEPVNLFLHNGSEAFIDEAVRYSLADPSYGVLGFGTQSSDFDNDGWPDLAVLNGHIFDDPKPDVALQMVPQLFAGSSRGFVSVGGDQAGAYWKTPQIGRTLAMMDWDRDGQMDLVANHIDRQPAVLQNQSQRVDVNQGPRNHWLQLELVGSISERDAIGAEVRVTSGDQTWTGWQIGGDGYMCTNEAVVHFGLGSIGQKVLVEIDWPSGSQSRYENVALDARYLAVEGVSGKRPPPLHLRHATVDSSSD